MFIANDWKMEANRQHSEACQRPFPKKQRISLLLRGRSVRVTFPWCPVLLPPKTTSKHRPPRNHRADLLCFRLLALTASVEHSDLPVWVLALCQVLEADPQQLPPVAKHAPSVRRDIIPRTDFLSKFRTLVRSSEQSRFLPFVCEKHDADGTDLFVSGGFGWNDNHRGCPADHCGGLRLRR